MSVSTGVNQHDAMQSVVDLWDPVKHPRGRDGKFIETGAFVQVFDGPGGAQIASGKVTAAYRAPDGRTFVGIDIGGGKIVWHRPKQIETVEVKGWLGPKPKDASSGEKPAMPLPSVPEKFEEIHWDDEPDYDPNQLTEAAAQHDAAWSPMVSKLVPWLLEQGFDPQVNDVYTEDGYEGGLIHVSNPNGGHETFQLSDKSHAGQSDNSDDLWATVKLGLAELLHDHEQPGGVPESETTSIVMDVPWHHPANWEGWLQAVGFLPAMTEVYQLDSNPEQLLLIDGMQAFIYQKGHEYSDVPIEVAQWAISSGTGSSSYTKVYDPAEAKAKNLAQNLADFESNKPYEEKYAHPGPEDPSWNDWLVSLGKPTDSMIYVDTDSGKVVIAEPSQMQGVEYNGDLEATGETISVEDLADASMDGAMTVVWPPLEGGDTEFSKPPEGWAKWLHDRTLSSTSNKVYVSSTGSIFVETDGADYLKQFALPDSKAPEDWDGGIPVSSTVEFVEGGDWTLVWPEPEVDFGELPPDEPPDQDVVQAWLDEYNLDGTGVYQYPGEGDVYVATKGGALYHFPDGILSSQVELSQMDPSEVTDPNSGVEKLWWKNGPSPIASWLDKLGVHGASVYQVPEQTGVYVVMPGYEGSNDPGSAWWVPGGVLSDGPEVASITAAEIENYHGIEKVWPLAAKPTMISAKNLKPGMVVTDPSIGYDFKIEQIGETSLGQVSLLPGAYKFNKDAPIAVVQGAELAQMDPLEEWEKELMEGAVEGPFIKIPAAGVAGLPGGTEIYTHPQGSTITVTPNGQVQKWNAQGKKAATSADALKLAQGHGQWKLAATTTGTGYNVVMHTEQGDQLGNYDTLLEGLKLAAVQPGDSAVPSPTGTEPTFPNIGHTGPGISGVWLSESQDAAWLKVGNDVWFAPKGNSKWILSSTTPEFLNADQSVVKAQYIAGPPGTETGAQVIPFETPNVLLDSPPAPAAPAAIKLPKGKTAEDALWMIGTSYNNKNPGDVAAQSGFANELATVLSLSTGYDVALKKLNALMTIAKLGGKQRARYKTLLQMHYGVTPEPGSSPVSAVAGDPGKWQPVTPPGGYSKGVTSFVAGNALVSSGGASAGTAKANIQENLSKRLAGRITMAQMLAAVKDTTYQSNGHLVTLADIAGNWGPTKSYSGGYLSKGGHLGIWQWSKTKPHNNAIPASQDNFERAMRESLTSQLVQLWAGTSNDSNPRSLAMQHAAQVEFGLKDTYEWPSDKAATKVEYDKHGAVFREFLRVMYENTQDWGKANGVKYVKLKRGMNAGANAGHAQIGANHDVQLRPMSSFTTNSGTATGTFGNGYVVEAVVPIEWIIGNAATGFGCKSEYEWVILGGRHKMKRIG